MMLSCNEFQLFCVSFFTHQALVASHDHKSARLSHTFRKCRYGRVTASFSWKLIGRETLHTQGFPHRPRAGDMIQMQLVRVWLAYGVPWRIAKRCVCALKPFAALRSIFVALLVRMPRIVSCCENASERKLKTLVPACCFIGTNKRSSIWTHQLPPNAALVSVSALFCVFTRC